MFGTAILFVFTGGAPFEKGAPPDPHPKTFDNLGHGVIVYNCAEILSLLIVRTTEMRRLMGPCFPTGGSVCAWSFGIYSVCSSNFQLQCHYNIIISIKLLLKYKLNHTDKSAGTAYKCSPFWHSVTTHNNIRMILWQSTIDSHYNPWYNLQTKNSGYRSVYRTAKDRAMNKSIQRAIAILDCLVKSPRPLGISEIARQLDIPKSSASDCLYTLHSCGCVVMNADKCFSIGSTIARLGTAALRLDRLKPLAGSILNSLHAEFAVRRIYLSRTRVWRSAS